MPEPPRCPYKIRWTYDTDAQCTKPEHVTRLSVEQVSDGRLSIDVEGDAEHTGLAVLEGQIGSLPVIRWLAGDRREFTGEWPGTCTTAVTSEHDGLPESLRAEAAVRTCGDPDCHIPHHRKVPGCVLHTGHHGRCAP